MLNYLHTNPAARLILFSFLVLFVELALIRWLGSNIVFLSYFSNLILLSSFLGIGVGFILADGKFDLSKWSPVLLSLLIVFVSFMPLNIVYQGNGMVKLMVLGSSAYTPAGFPVWFTLPVIFLLVTAVMASIAQGAAFSFKFFKPLAAYRLDIIGALAGIVTFTALAFLHCPPLVWGTVVFIIFYLLLFKREAAVNAVTLLQIVAMCTMLGTLAWESMTPNTFWSPYYKISLRAHNDKEHTTGLFVNNIPHQVIETAEHRIMNVPFYTYPYQHKQNQALDKVLIIGAGTGGDVAIALFADAKHIDAVEIDPTIAHIGSLINRDQVYENPKVNLSITDGRSFLQQSHELYDLILFALPDSLTLVSGQSSLRLESYLFTQEAITAAKQHLKPDGVFAMYNFYWQSWLVDRLGNTLHTVFNQAPCLDYYPQLHHLAVFTVGSNSKDVVNCGYYWNKPVTEEMQPATDDHPFLYLKSKEIPLLYQISLGLIFLTTVITMFATKVSLKSVVKHGDVFFMGMAFLLLETKSVVAFSLLFGNTWLVNALVFFSILVLVYLAIETVMHFPRLSFRWLYSLLLGMLALEWFTPLSYLLDLPVMLRFVAASVLLISPIYLANLIFATQFQHEGNKATLAFGVNMIGAMIGGLLEYLALVTGYNFLIILVGVLYTIAFLLGRSKAGFGVVISEKVFST
jgi:spermidine synthase